MGPQRVSADIKHATSVADPSNGGISDVPKEQPWHAAYPEPRSEPQPIPRHEVLQMLKDLASTPQREQFVLIDLRRTDYEASK